jgi:ABC-type sugar transport system, periplasmic component
LIPFDQLNKSYKEDFMGENVLFKKVLSTIIIASFVFTILFTGCGKSGAQNTGSTQTGAAVSQTAKAASSSVEKKEPGAVSVMTIDSSYIQKNYDQGLPVLQQIEKNLNIKIDWQLLPSDGYEDALKIKLAAGTDMPDIFASWQQSPEVLAKNNTVVALSDYFDSTMKNTKNVISSDSVLRTAVTSPDGKVYFLPVKDLQYDVGWQIRQDWLDKLGLQVPQTIDELYNVLVAFRDKDPNGNGKKDEVPIAINDMWYTWMYLMQAYGLQIADPWNFVGKDKDEKVYIYVTRPEFKETIAFISKLYKEKLLNQDILNVTGDSYKKIISENRVGCTFSNLYPENVNMIKEVNPNVNPILKVMLPPKGPRGDSGIRSYSSIDGRFFISKVGKNTTDAVRLFDYIFADPEGSVLINWGIKGLTYTEENGQKKFTELITKNPDGLNISDAIAAVGIWPTLPRIASDAKRTFKNLTYAENPWISEGVDLYAKNNVVGEQEKRYRFTEEEASQIDEINKKLNSYISETLAKMIIGNTPIDEFDNFVKTVNDKGIEKLAEIYQAAEDRSK